MFYILALSGDQVAGGALFQIGDAVHDAFVTTSKAIIQQGLHGRPEQMVILFENSHDNPHFWEKWGDDVHEVLYLNEAAKDVLDRAGHSFAYGGTTNAAPANHGTFMQMPRYIITSR